MNCFYASIPPSTVKVLPVMYDAAEETRKSIIPDISLGLAILPSGICWRTFLINSSFWVSAEANYVSVNPGRTALTRILSRPSSLAKACVIEMSAALVME